MNNKPNDPKEKQMIKILSVYLEKMLKLDASDLHIKAESLIKARIKGDIISLSTSSISRENVLILAKALLGGRFLRFAKEKSADLMFQLDDKFRFRVNLFFQIDGISGVFRKIPTELPNILDMKLPEVILELSNLSRGLILVTGPTGSGKSTTLAAIINHINKTKKKHIITIEDPVEFLHKDILSLINQRAVGEDAIDFSSSLRDALREDPDIILIGEMRDTETINMALHAAETGHLVFSTLHTIDTKETLNRIIGIFGAEEQNRIRLSLASVLQGILSQRLVKTVKDGRVAVVEVLIKTSRIQELIIENRDNEILTALKEGKEIYKTQTFDQALLEYYNKGIISIDEAIWNATNPADLQLHINNIGDEEIKKEEDFKLSLK